MKYLLIISLVLMGCGTDDKKKKAFLITTDNTSVDINHIIIEIDPGSTKETKEKRK